MKVGILTYPMLFQNEGGLQVQIYETIRNLRKIGVKVDLVDLNQEKLEHFDIVHVFAAIHGNDKLVEQAKIKGCKVILSPLINPSLVPPSTLSLHAVKILSRVLSRLSNYTVTTNYTMVKRALTGAHHLVALGKSECSILENTYNVDRRNISIVPNGVSSHFFEANARLFLEKYKILRPFVFCPGQISPWKNQKTLVQALAGTGIEIVLAGPINDGARQYLYECLNMPNTHVSYIGNLNRNSPEFAACYGAASAVVLPSKGESGPLVALESLAAGTPAIITKKNGLDIESDGQCLNFVEPFNILAMRDVINSVVSNRPSKEQCQKIVDNFSWLKVAERIAKIYERQMK